MLRVANFSIRTSIPGHIVHPLAQAGDRVQLMFRVSNMRRNLPGNIIRKARDLVEFLESPAHSERVGHPIDNPTILFTKNMH